MTMTTTAAMMMAMMTERGSDRPDDDTIPDLQLEDTTGGPRDSAHTGPRRMPARVRIMAWVVLLMTALLVLVNVVTWQALGSEVDGRIDRALTQEIDEFQEFAAVGVNPETGSGFTDVSSLLETYLVRQHPDRHEIIFAHVDDVPGAQVPTGRIRQGQEPLVDVSTDSAVRTTILDSTHSRGSAETPEGELRWEKVRVEPPRGSDNPGGWFIIGFFADVDREGVDQTVRTLLLVSLIGLVLTGASAWWVAGRILAPIRLVRQTAAHITEEDLTQRIDVPGNDDVAALAEQFNAMLDRLEEAFSGQRRFVDDASHELRTPITIVRGHLEVMGDSPEERREVVRLVTDELDRMTRIVEDLLLLAKAQRPDFLHWSKTSIAELTSDIDAKVRALGERDWRLESIGEGTARLDPQRVTQAMVQLAHNAVRHTEPGDLIRVGSALSEDGTTVDFWVCDSGPGISSADQERIFDRFSRGTGSSRDRSGAGLGLAIVRAIVEAHRGRVDIDSAPGRGAAFTLRFPLGQGGVR
ncbi:signal transduction histidine kinase [Murinocardiopsis flavida]|uniref:histidine kinase n=2 Tax=Murinocardiopsis flavida TaxID=645275 RepID=A0A2P8DQF9_9ACTN|nr:signal transduction histidine kinase [Murinocardiopsis flavida]